MKIIDEKVVQMMEELHEREAQYFNKGKSRPEIFTIGQKVWYRRPEGSGEKLDGRWLGPALVSNRVGENRF